MERDFFHPGWLPAFTFALLFGQEGSYFTGMDGKVEKSILNFFLSLRIGELLETAGMGWSRCCGFSPLAALRQLQIKLLVLLPALLNYCTWLVYKTTSAPNKTLVFTSFCLSLGHSGKLTGGR